MRDRASRASRVARDVQLSTLSIVYLSCIEDAVVRCGGTGAGNAALKRRLKTTGRLRLPRRLATQFRLSSCDICLSKYALQPTHGGTTQLSPQMCSKPFAFQPPLLLWPWGLGAVCAMLGSFQNTPVQADQGRYARTAAPNAEPKKHP